jgi:hypothetical protein
MSHSERVRRAFSVGLLALSAAASSLALENDSKPKARLDAAYGRIPLSFEANHGQAASAVRFLSRGRGYSLLLKSSEAVFALTRSEGGGPPSPPAMLEDQPRRHDTSIVRMKFLGANPNASLAGVDEQSNKSNYFIGKNPRKWHTRVPNYARVVSRQLYPGIDLLYHGSQRQLEYDLVVAPGARTDAIRIAFEGIERLRLDAAGDLILETRQGELRQARPLVYQEVGGERCLVAADYVLEGGHRLGFRVARHDATQPLVIDPVLSYSSYLGGSGDDFGLGIAVDGEGNAYVTGTTLSKDFPTPGSLQPASGGSYDAFVAKISSAGSLVYSTYLGGGGLDEGHGIAVDSEGNAYVTGRTTSTNFPTKIALQPNYNGKIDAFVAKLDATGSDLVYSTYLGGVDNDTGIDIAVDSLGNAYVARIITASGPQFLRRSLVQKIDSTGSALLYSKSVGGNPFLAPTNTDVYAIAVDGSGNAYVTGDSTSLNLATAGSFQTTNGGYYDAIVAKINAAGSAFDYFTYLGGSGLEEGFGIAVDSGGNAFVTGLTASTNFPTQKAFQPAHSGGIWDGFVAEINAAGSALVYSTYLGGSGYEVSSDIALDGSGNAYVAGYTSSTDFPIKDAFQPRSAGGVDAFVTKFNAEGSLVYSSYLGTSGDDSARSIAVDGSGSAYITGTTDSTNFPTQNPFQPASGGGRDAFVAKISTPAPPPAVTTASFFTLAPCRLVDTRGSAGPLGGPALIAGVTRRFTATGHCGIPSTAKALSVNVTTTQTIAAGDLRLFPVGIPMPATSAINYRAHQTRANNAVMQLGTDGDLQVFVDQPAGTVQLIVDVNGYFQ